MLYPYEVELINEVDRADLLVSRTASSNSPKPLIRVPTYSDRQDGYGEPVCHGNGIVDLPFDVIAACRRRLKAVMNPKVSFAYRFSARLDFARYFSLSPIKNRLLRARKFDWIL